MDLYKKWVPKWVIHFCNFFLIMVFTNTVYMNIVGYDMSLIQGHFGATAEELQLSSQLPIAIMLVMAPFGLTMAFRVPIRKFLIIWGLIAAFFFMACLFAPTIQWFTFFKILLYVSALFGLLCSIIPVMLTYNPTFSQPMLFALLYSVAFGFADLFKFSGTYILSRFNWEFGFLFFTVLILIAVLLAFIFFKKEHVPKPPDGNKLDVPGITILLGLFITITFIVVKGANEHWFESSLIQGLTALCIIIIGLYILYAKNKKNAYIQLEVFTYKNTLVGGFLLIATGFLLITAGGINSLMGMSGFNNIATGKAYLPQVIGVFAASIFCVAAIKYKVYISTLCAAGFLSLSLFHLTMFLHFYPGVGTHDFFWPLILRGAGEIFLYLSLGIYVAENIPNHLSGSRVLVSFFFKITLGMFIGGGIYGYFTAKDNELHQTGISQEVTAVNTLAQQQYSSSKALALSQGADENESNRFATKMLSSKINQPASLLANKDLYLVCGLIGLMMALLVSFFRLMQHPAGKIEVEPVPL